MTTTILVSPPPRSSSTTYRRRRHSTPFTTRPAIRHSCGGCHEALSSPTDLCWKCGQRVAGIRWLRLFFHLTIGVAILGVALSLAGMLWRIVTG